MMRDVSPAAWCRTNTSGSRWPGLWLNLKRVWIGRCHTVESVRSLEPWNRRAEFVVLGPSVGDRPAACLLLLPERSTTDASSESYFVRSRAQHMMLSTSATWVTGAVPNGWHAGC